MKIKQLFSFVFISLLAFLAFTALKFDKNNASTTAKWTPPELSPSDWMAMQRAYPHGMIKQESYLHAMEQTLQMMNSDTKSSTIWTYAGPSNIGGRITDIEVSPINSNIIYLGAATGGVLYSENGGTSWQNLFNNMPVISIGDLAIDPSNPNTIWCGTGEANSSSFSFLGNGIYRSTNKGTTWQHMGLTHSAYIGRVIVDYSNSNRVFAAACGNLFSSNDERGIYRTNDGGNTWERVLFVTDSTAAIDLVQHPTDPDILYASMWERARGLTYRRSFGESSGIYKTTDGGNTWTKLTSGLPTGQVGRIGIDISKSDPDILFAVYDMPDTEVGVYKTTNGGNTWARTNDGSLYGMMSNFGWYFGQIRIDPVNPNKVFVMGVPLYYTTNGGTSWQESGGSDLHVDHHAMHFTTDGKIYEGNDGGFYKSSNGGVSWSKVNNLAITQFYAIDIDYKNPEVLIGGTQDNNTIITYNGNTNNWVRILGGDGMYCLIDYDYPDTLYAEYQYGNLYRSTNKGLSMEYISGPMAADRVYWSAPLVMHPQVSSTLYFGTYRVWRSNNNGTSWTPVSSDLTGGLNNPYSTLSTMDISPLNPSIIVTGSCDGKVNITENGGFSWKNISEDLPQRWITKVKTDPNNVNTIYVTLSGFRWDETYSHVYKTTDLGNTWIEIGETLPDIPVNDIVIDPLAPGRLIVGTDAGMFASDNDGTDWQWIWNGVPAVPVCALKIHQPTRSIVAGTYGLSMYRASLDDIFTGIKPPDHKILLKLAVSPNPSSNFSYLDFYLPDNEKAEIRIVDINGKVQKNIFKGPIPKGAQHLKIPLGGLSAGMYYIQLSGEKVHAIAKMIVL